MEPVSNLNKLIKILVIADAVVLNVALGWLIYKFSIFLPGWQTGNFQSISQNQNPQIIQKTEYLDQCGVECRKYIDTKIAETQSDKAVEEPAPTNKIVYREKPKPKTRTVSYVTIPGSGQTTKSDWTDLSGTDFYFNPADYPGLVEVYFESTMRLFNGNGMAYVRLLDVTHGIGVQGSDVQTNQQTASVITSGQVTFWSGKNLIRVQIKSLTADTAIFDTGRLRIVSEN